MMPGRSVLLAVVLFSWSTVSSVRAEGREVQNFDRDWRFHLGDRVGAEKPESGDADWRTLNLPHDYSIEGPTHAQSAMEGPFDRNSPAGPGGAYLNGGMAWYRKTFTVPIAARDRRTTILFDGAYMNAEVWINGHDLGVRPYGFSSFYYDLTPWLNFGRKNVLAVKLNDEQPSCRWYSGAGIYRHVWLIETAPVHLAIWGTAVTTPPPAGLDFTREDALPATAAVRVQSKVTNDGAAPATARLATIILAPDGREVARQTDSQTLAPAGSATFDQTLQVARPEWWSVDAPRLYRVKSEIRVGGRLVDSTTTPLGIRYFAFTKDRGFFLNGRHVPIRGVCDHHDLGALGTAVNRRALERQLEILRAMGCNAIRTSHNPPAPELLELCDRMGFLVMDEAFDEWKQNHSQFGYGPFFDQWSEPDLVTMLDRDRNHPSIVLWSIGNEIIEGRLGDPVAGPMAQRLVAICHREDPSRPVTSACPEPANAWNSGLARALDVFGINYRPEFYKMNNPSNPASNAGAGDYRGQLPFVASETSSQVDARGEYGLQPDGAGDALPTGQVSSYDVWHAPQTSSGETDLLDLQHSPWVAGEFIWSGFDYLGEPMPYGWPSRSSYFGVVDLCGFPKDRFYLYQSQWTTRPMVHILPMSWTWPGLEGRTIPVRIFTNADSVELFLNGRSLGAKTVRDHLVQLHLEWSVPYVPGELRAAASQGGSVVATDSVRTAGVPAGISLKPDRVKIRADGEDLCFIDVSVVDKDGTICPNAANSLTFSVQGPAMTLAALDDGDPTNHESFQGTQHRVFHGRGLAVLKSAGDMAGSTILTVKSDGLPPMSCTVKSLLNLAGNQHGQSDGPPPASSAN